jgi:hypothetical protein
MQYNEFREAGHYLIDYIADYLEHAKEEPLFADAEPSLLYELFNEPVPENARALKDIQRTLEKN